MQVIYTACSCLMSETGDIHVPEALLDPNCVSVDGYNICWDEDFKQLSAGL